MLAVALFAERWAHLIIALLVLAGGLALMFSNAVPETNWRRALVRDILPLPFAEASHLSASLAGLALVVLARGLALRMAQARIVAMGMLVAGSVFALAKGFDWEEALLLLATAAVLWLARSVFYRRGNWRSFRPSAGWLALVALTLLAVAAVGFLGYGNVAYRSDLWWRFAWHGDAPRFLRATLALTLAVAVLGLDRLVNRPLRGRDVAEPLPDAAVALIAACPDSIMQVAYLGDKQVLLSPDGDAALFYAAAGGSWVCLCGPIGAPKAADDLLWTFVEKADRAGMRPVFYAVEPSGIMRLLDFGHAILKTGEVARVDLTTFTLDGPDRKDLRYARSRAARDGLRFGLISREDVPGHLGDLKTISDVWLAQHGGREKGFSLGRFDPAYLTHFDLAVIWQGDQIVAFANLWRGADKGEIAIDLMRHLPGLSPILMDFLMTEAILLAQSEGYRWFNLGGAPLAGLRDHPLASTWNRIGTMIYRRGDDFYSFEGLSAFKRKFGPVWTPRYVTCPGGMSLFRTLIDVTLLISRPRRMGAMR